MSTQELYEATYDNSVADLAERIESRDLATASYWPSPQGESKWRWLHHLIGTGHSAGEIGVDVFFDANFDVAWRFLAEGVDAVTRTMRLFLDEIDASPRLNSVVIARVAGYRDEEHCLRLLVTPEDPEILIELYESKWRTEDRVGGSFDLEIDIADDIGIA